MTDWSANFLDRDGQLFRRTLGEILAELLRHRFPRDAAKKVERRYDLAPVTAKKVIQGHVSERSLASVLYGEGEDVFELLDAIGHQLTGKTRAEWEEQKFQQILGEANRAAADAQAQIHRLRTRRDILAQAATVAHGEAEAWSPVDHPWTAADRPRQRGA